MLITSVAVAEGDRFNADRSLQRCRRAAHRPASRFRFGYVSLMFKALLTEAYVLCL